MILVIKQFHKKYRALHTQDQVGVLVSYIKQLQGLVSKYVEFISKVNSGVAMVYLLMIYTVQSSEF